MHIYKTSKVRISFGGSFFKKNKEINERFLTPTDKKPLSSFK